jgi:RND family efflux transporter MFP subunit
MRRKSMSRKLREMKPWLAILVIVVLIGAASAMSIGCGGGSEGSATAGNQTQVATVRYGNLTSEISAGGSLVYGTSQQLSFDTAGELQDVYVEKDDQVTKGEVLARLASTNLLILTLQENVARAKVDLKNAKQALEDLLQPYEEELNIADARQAVHQANETLVNVEAQGQFDIATADWAVRQADDDRNSAVTRYMGGVIDLEEMQKAWTDWQAAQLHLEVVKQNAENVVYNAQSALQKARDKLDKMLEAPDPEDVDLGQRQIATAQGELDDAQDKLTKAMGGYPLVAPFDGVVVSVNADVAPGDDVNANTVILEVADTSVIDMSGTVDEVDVANVKLGQYATVTLDALPELELSGNVTGISAFAQSQSGVVSYPITVSLTIPKGTRLLQGMSATAAIKIELASNALLVPNGAIVGPSDRPAVMVMVNGQPQPRMVTVGATDGVRTEVVTGLKEGDVVIVNVATGSTSPGQTPQGFGPPEGFIPPEGFGPGGGGGFFHRD